ncbi:MAG: alpha/beta fold hydrolase, partial [Acidimicrobiales bacterium]
GAPEAVLVHGSAQNAHTWDTVALALGRPLVCFDLPGHGRSTWRPDHDYSPSSLADVLAVGIEELAPDARMLVGMSLGGLASLYVAARRPDLVAALVLVDITPGVDAGKAGAITAFVSGPTRFPSFDEILERTIRHNPGRSEASLRRGVLHNAHELPDGSWAWRWDPDGMAVRSQDPARGHATLWDDLAATAMPLTLVRGDRSPVVDDADIAALLQRRPDAKDVVVEGAGHSVQGDRPLELAEILAGLLDGR